MDENIKADNSTDYPITNNVMRHDYRALRPSEVIEMKAVKDAGLAFWELCDRITVGRPTREMSLAKMKIEEAVMWATKHITR